MPFKTHLKTQKIVIELSKEKESSEKSKFGNGEVIVNIEVHSNGETSKKISVNNLDLIDTQLSSCVIESEQDLFNYEKKIQQAIEILSSLREIVSTELK